MAYKPHDDDTIIGIATPPGEGALGVVRLSGKDAVRIADTIFRSKSGQPVSAQKTFTAQYGQILDPKAAERRAIDEVVLTLMRGPKSFTAEDVVEISAHAGTAVLRAILELGVRQGARPAERGEFTKRAFLNGRIDLVQAEAVLDLIQAKTELGRAWASEKLEGAASKKIRALKVRLVEELVHLEAAIDFPDDFPDTKSIKGLSKTLESVQSSLASLLTGSDLGIVVQRGLVASIAGRPNVGKSSLMNELTREDRVIVTPHPGTTRDVVEAEIQVRGIPVRLQDTAGIQNTKDPIEKEGIDRSRRAVGGADLILYVMDSSADLAEEDEELIRDLKDRKKIFVLNKTDLPVRVDRFKLTKLDPGAPIVGISCIDHKGIDELEAAIFGLMSQSQLSSSGSPFVSTVRQKECLEKAMKSVSDANEACRKDASPELIAVDMRLAIDSLGALTGEVYTDDILEALFSRFCIGK